MNGVGLSKGGDHRSNAAAAQDNRNMSTRGDVEGLSDSRRQVPDYDRSIFAPKEPKEERTPLPQTSLRDRVAHDRSYVWGYSSYDNRQRQDGSTGCTLV